MMFMYRLNRTIGDDRVGTIVFRTEPLPRNYQGTATVYRCDNLKRIDAPASRLVEVDMPLHETLTPVKRVLT